VRRSLVIAEACGLPCVVASTGQSTIGLAAGLALAGALPELRYPCAFDTASLLSGDLVAGPRSLIPVGGYLPVAPMPPAPDPELVTQYALADSDRIAWWRDRLRIARTTP
jgi:O-succinylbenzoate synthase